MSAWELGPEGERELLVETARELVEGAPEGAASVRLVCGGLGYAEEVRAYAEMEDGERLTVKVPPLAQLNLQKLRRGMYREGRGTWFSLDLTVSDGRFDVSFDHELEPPYFESPPARELIAAEERRFPREAEWTPGWFLP
ncbi:hypothetical protein [Nocardiopsis halophila]|uniref:hypothetical protein n=1 Tax=Nocardiopsis halophila TaxID=141692 RepID=UPI00034C606C|nr:hypothetical protein [Nocardiopsis halophila]